MQLQLIIRILSVVLILTMSGEYNAMIRTTGPIDLYLDFDSEEEEENNSEDKLKEHELLFMNDDQCKNKFSLEGSLIVLFWSRPSIDRITPPPKNV